MTYTKCAIVNDSLIEIPIPKHKVILGNIFADCFEEALKAAGISYERNLINGIGPDFWLEDNTLAELKNVKHFIYTLSTFEGEVEARYKPADNNNGSKPKLLAISKMKCLSNPAVQRRIHERNIYVITLGYQLRSRGRQFRKAVHIFTKKIKAYLKHLKRVSITVAEDVAVFVACLFCSCGPALCKLCDITISEGKVGLNSAASG